MKNLIYLLLILGSAAGCRSEVSQAREDTRPYVILVSFDGFRYDYADKYALPNLTKFISEGSEAEYMIPSFPSKTFPNHYSLVTGLYPSHHGLVDNTFYDSARNERYTIGNRKRVEDPFYYSGTPLWQLAQSQGVKSASFFWVGSETEVAGAYPSYYKRYDDDFPDEQRIDTVIHWLNLPPEERPHFISLYFSVVDHISHDFGPVAQETEDTVRYADRLIGRLMAATDSLDLPINIIIVSDHGMYEMNNADSTYIQLDEIMQVPDSGVHVVNNSTHVHIHCEEPLRSRLYNQAVTSGGPFSVYYRENTPAHWHYREHYRIGDLILAADPGHSFGRRHESAPYGYHGYDPHTTPEMGAIFYARGPQIRKGYTIAPFENVHVYPLIAAILGISAPETDGRAEVLSEILIK